MKDSKTKKFFWKKLIFIFLFAFSASFTPLHKADAWLSIPAAIIGDVMDWLEEEITGIITGMIKQAGAKAINMMISKIVGGGASGKPMFITDWGDYLTRQPRQKTQNYMNDYLTQMTRGRGSVALYISNSAFEGVGLGAFNTGVSAYGNHSSRLSAIGQQRIAKRSGTGAIPNITFTGNPGDMFSQFNFKQFDVYMDGVNNPWAFDAAVAEEEEEVLAEEEAIAQTKATANQGFEGTEVDGQTITPGSLVMQKMADTEDIGNKILASASSMGEAVSAVVTTLVTKAIEQGIGAVQAKVQKEVIGVQNKAARQIRSEINNIGPKAVYRKPGF